MSSNGQLFDASLACTGSRAERVSSIIFQMAPPDLQLLNASFAPDRNPPPPLLGEERSLLGLLLPQEERSGDGDRLLQELLEGVASSAQPFCSMSCCTSLSTMSRFEPSSSSHES